MSSLLPLIDVSKFERTASLLKIREQLTNDNLSARFQCLYYIPGKENCTYNCRYYEDAHRGIFETASRVLLDDVDQVGTAEFLKVMRTLFCGDHDPFTGNINKKAYKKHLGALWECADEAEKNAIWDTLRDSGRGIYQPTTPRRSRPERVRVNTEPKKLSNTYLKVPGAGPSTPGNKDPDTPTRPRSAQAQLGRNIEDVDIAPTSPSPSVVPQAHIPSEAEMRVDGSLNFSQPLGSTVKTSKDFAQIPAFHLPLRFNVEPAGNKSSSDTSGGLKSHQNLPSEATAPSNSKKQTMNLPKFESIFDKLEKSAQDMYSLNTQAAEKYQQPPVHRPEAKQDSRGLETQTPMRNFEPPAYPWVTTSRDRWPATRQYEEQASTIKSPSPTPGNPFRFHMDSPTVTSPTIKEEPVSPSPPNSPSSKPAPTKYSFDNTPETKKLSKPHAYDPRRPEAIASTIRRILLAPLIEERTGAIYVLEAPAFFSTFAPARAENKTWVKIGISSDVTKRINSLTVKCGITGLRDVYVSDAGTMRMDLLRRIEKVCHVELNNFRRRMDCKHEGVVGGKCTTVHDEWFAVEADVAVRTVERWRGFLDHEPYTKVGKLDGFWEGRLSRKNYGRVKGDEGLGGHEWAHKTFDGWLEESVKEKI
jgi:hypothetical protein